MTQQSITLASLALLKARYDVERKDIIDNLIPFASYILDKRRITRFTVEELKEWLLEDFGLTFPLHPIGLIAGRMVTRGCLTKKEYSYIVENITSCSATFDKSREENQLHLEATTLGLMDYCSTHLSQIISRDEAEQYLFQYIDEYAIECIQAYSSGDSVKQRDNLQQAWRFMVNSYVSHISTHDRQKFEYFSTVLTGRMLSNALLAPDISSVKMKFRNTVIFLDTVIILRLIGVLGEMPQECCVEMIELYRQASASIEVFKHTMDEVDIVLRSAEHTLETNSMGYGSVIIALKEARKKPSDVAFMRINLEEILREHNIKIRATPDYITKYQIDEVGLEKEMEDAGLRYKNDAAKRTDINSVRSIYVLRSGKSPSRVEDCAAILVTTNSAFARAAYSYGHRYKEFQGVSPVITDFSLTNIVWLKSPIDFAGLPGKILAANCYAAMKPSDELWTAFLEELEKLESKGKITPTQHQYMRYELLVRPELMNLTLGDENLLSEEKILQVLDRHEQEIVRPWKTRYDELEKNHSQTSLNLTKIQQSYNSILERVKKIGILSEKIISYALVMLCVIFLMYAQGMIGD